MTNTNHEDVEEFTIEGLMGSTDNYIIPIYQRNYAWITEEVNQLLHDITDMQKTNSGKNYYIGTLVVSKQNGKFEVLDGQQRLTTLSIILSVLKNSDILSVLKNSDILSVLKKPDKKINLDFDSRKDSSVALQNLWSRGQCNEAPMQNAYQTINEFLNNLGNVDGFVDFLLKQVVVIRVTVPEHTDRNKYFETMHTRGEQLEKHEVLKARMMEALNKAEHHCFATIWDACADMTRFVQMGFDSKIRISIFGDDVNTIPSDFCKILDEIEKEKKNSDTTGEETLKSLLENLPKETSCDDEKGGSNDDGKFEVVNIDFPNFLLHVLRISIEFSYGNGPMAKECAKVVSLDDKKFINEFDKNLPTISNKKIESEVVKKFAMDLLKCRMLFDRYIIKKHNEKDDWGILELQKDEKHKYRKQLILLQSMFHVSFSSKNHKHWLSAALRYLYQQKEPIKIDCYICFLEELSDKFFWGRYDSDSQVDYEELVYGNFSPAKIIKRRKLRYDHHILRYVFNYLDYLLWKDDALNNKNRGLIERDKNYFNEFKFKIRSSIEHHSPQTPKQVGELPVKNLHSFGNLCLMNSEENSKFRNDSASEKRKSYPPQSLKQAVMFGYEEWTEKDIFRHGKDMISLLQAGTKG